MWGWFYGMSIRQINLLRIDQPCIVYPKHNRSSKDGNKKSFKKEEPKRPKAEAINAAIENWKRLNEKGLATNVSIDLSSFKK